MRFILTLSLLLSPIAGAAAQVSGQSFEVTPESPRATVGDSVTLRFRVRLDERDLLFDTVPKPIDALPPGVRLLSVEKMTRTPDRLFHGRARLVFLRPGRQAVPVFGLPFMRAVKGVSRATLPSDSAFVDIVPLLPAGNPALKDIKEIEPKESAPLWPYAAGAGVALLLAFVLRRRGRTALVLPAPMPSPVPAEATPTAYTKALTRLDRIERAGWPDRGDVERHYESIVDVLRRYLEEADGVAARESTTAELVWALPPSLSEAGGREALQDLLDEADLVKFALFRPAAPAAAAFLQRSRKLLHRWHRTPASEMVTDAAG
jgi:hypothetical protein